MSIPSNVAFLWAHYHRVRGNEAVSLPEKKTSTFPFEIPSARFLVSEFGSLSILSKTNVFARTGLLNKPDLKFKRTTQGHAGSVHVSKHPGEDAGRRS